MPKWLKVLEKIHYRTHKITLNFYNFQDVKQAMIGHVYSNLGVFDTIVNKLEMLKIMKMQEMKCEKL